MLNTIKEAAELEQQGKIDDSVDLVFNFILDANEEILKSIDDDLKELKTSELSTRMIVNILVATLPFHELKNRDNFYNDSWTELERREGGERTNRLLQGLNKENSQTSRAAHNWIRKNITGEKLI